MFAFAKELKRYSLFSQIGIRRCHCAPFPSSTNLKFPSEQRPLCWLPTSDRELCSDPTSPRPVPTTHHPCIQELASPCQLASVWGSHLGTRLGSLRPLHILQDELAHGPHSGKGQCQEWGDPGTQGCPLPPPCIISIQNYR